MNESMTRCLNVCKQIKMYKKKNDVKAIAMKPYI